MTWANYILLLLGISWALTGLYGRYARRKGYVDMPNIRSSHYVVTPRGGGIIFSTLFFALLGFAYYKEWNNATFFLPMFLPALAIVLIGFYDDMKNASVKARLIVQVLASVVSLYFIAPNYEPLLLGLSLPHWATLLILAMAMVWMTNLMNFMDGTDGLCASGAIIILGVASWMLYQSGAYTLTIFSVGACALIGGFLTWNWPTAHLFMGDSGSGFIGFLIALMAIVSHKWFKLPYEIWLILSGLYWFDATVTLARRILNKDKWTEAHCLHAYQRLTHVGWSHASILVGSILINSVLAVLALLVFKYPGLSIMFLGISICFLTVIYLLIEIHKPMYKTWHA